VEARELILVTVSHSGTMRAIELLGLKVCPVTEPEPGKVLFAHPEDASMPFILEAAMRMPMLVTQRPREDVRKSWIKRGRNLNELEEQVRNFEALMAFRPYVLVLGDDRTED